MRRERNALPLRTQGDALSSYSRRPRMTRVEVATYVCMPGEAASASFKSQPVPVTLDARAKLVRAGDGMPAGSNMESALDFWAYAFLRCQIQHFKTPPFRSSSFIYTELASAWRKYRENGTQQATTGSLQRELHDSSRTTLLMHMAAKV